MRPLSPRWSAWRIGACVALISMLAGMPSAADQGPSRPPVEEVTVPPHEIPEHFVWKFQFEAFAGLKSRRDALVRQDAAGDKTKITPLARTPDGQTFKLELTDRDLDTLLQAAAAHEERSVACQQKLESMVTELGKDGRSPEEIAKRLEDPRVECRQQVLDARDRLLEAMSPEGATNLRMYVYYSRFSMTVKWPKAELAHFMRPQ